MIVYIIIIAAFQTQYNINMAFSMSGVWIPPNSVFCTHSRQVYLLLWEATEVLSHFIRKYFRLKTVSSTTPFYKKKMLSLQAKGCDYFFENLVQKGGGGRNHYVN